MSNSITGLNKTGFQPVSDVEQILVYFPKDLKNYPKGIICTENGAKSGGKMY